MPDVSVYVITRVLYIKLNELPYEGIYTAGSAALNNIEIKLKIQIGSSYGLYAKTKVKKHTAVA